MPETIKKSEQFGKRTGKIIVHGFAEDTEQFASKALEIEQYLNDRVATDVHKKFGLAIRIHL